jgi:hypothetical protein
VLGWVRREDKSLLRLGLLGAVLLAITTGMAGSSSTTDALPTESRLQAAWRFAPALLDGRPVSVLYVVTVNFRLGRGARSTRPSCVLIP